MRLQRLDLIRYGKFTDYSIDFDKLKHANSDFHIIYGLNEAGKSTTLSAYLDLLFGIEHKSAYGFKHKYDTMEIGATLDIAGQSTRLLRNKSRKNSLRDNAGEPVDTGLLDATLAGLGREAYTTMFSLDDESLEQGGESILSNQGHLGELLYSASSGVAGLTQRLEHLRAEAEIFYKSRGQKHLLGDLLAELDGVKRTRDGINDKADQYAQLVSIRDACQQKYDDVLQERTEFKLRIKHIDKLLTAKPRYDELAKLTTQLQPLSSLPEVPGNWSEDLPQLETDTMRLNLQKNEINSNLAKIEQELETITVDEVVLQAQKRFDELDGARARYRLKMENRPELERKLQALEHSVTAALAKLEQPQNRKPESLLFTVSTVAALEELIEVSVTQDIEHKNAQSELEKAEKILVSSRTALDSAAGEKDTSSKYQETLRELERAVAPYEGNNLLAQQHAAISARDNAQDELDRVWTKLRPWAGKQDLLAAMDVPDIHSLIAMTAELDSAQQKLSETASEKSRLEGELTSLQAQLRSINQTVGVVNDTEFTSLRERRDQAWTEHRRQLSDVTADAFKELLDKDDQAQFARLHHADVVANLNQTTQFLIQREAMLELAGDKHLVAEREHRLQVKSIQKTAMSISPMLGELSATALKDWLDIRESALDLVLTVNKFTRELSAAEGHRDKAASAVMRALQAAGVQADENSELDELLDAARTASGKLQLLVSLQEKLHDDERQLAIRQQNQQEAQAALAQWQQDWQALCSSCWLGESDSVPTPKAVKEIISELRKLEPWLGQRHELVSDLDGLQLNKAKIDDEVKSLCLHIGLNPDGLEPDEQYEKISQRIDESIKADHTRKSLSQSLGELKEKSNAVQQDLEVNAQTAGAMYRCFGLSSLAGVREKLEQVKEKDRLQMQAHSEQKQLLEILSVASVEDATAEFETFDKAQFERDLTALESQASDLDTRAQELYADLQKSESELQAIGSDSDVALLEEQREVLEMDILDKTKNYLAQRLGILATERALHRFRDTHRSSMLQQASKAFATISRGAYSRLETQATASAEKLIGITANGSSKDSGDMSKGTRFQLYLALRVAGYHEYVKTRPSLPFIADDIMETFDDERAAEAFKVFANMASVGQVIYLTHHEHLCEIAKSVCPSVNIHKLNDPVS